MSQKERLRNLFKSKPNQRISLREIIYLGIAMYPPRIKELRSEGMNIINHEERINGQNHSWYEYLPEGELLGAAGYSQRKGV